VKTSKPAFGGKNIKKGGVPNMNLIYIYGIRKIGVGIGGDGEEPFDAP